MTVGENVRKHRKMRGLKQYELAKKVGVHRSAVSKWESSDHSFTVSTLRRIATALNVSVVDLVSDN